MNAYNVLSSAQKGGFLKEAAAEGIALLFPDTSPRGAGCEDETKDWDFGVGEYTNHTHIVEKGHIFTSVFNLFTSCWILFERDKPQILEILQYAETRH